MQRSAKEVELPGISNESLYSDLLCLEALCNYSIWVVNLIRNNNNPSTYLVLGD